MISRTLRFSHRLYSPKSVLEAVKEFQSVYGKEINFTVKVVGGKSEVLVSASDVLGKDMFDEFANFVLFFNIY